MATENLDLAARKDWILANPWPWLGVGFGFVAWSWLWTFVFGEIASDYRIIVLAVGLLLSGVAVWLRWNERQAV